jgi:hypothetical protein
LNDEAKIPHDVVVSAGLPPRSRSWTCSVYVLKRKGIPVQGDEDFFPPDGWLHLLPVDAPRWMGSNPPGGNVAAARLSSCGNSSMGSQRGDNSTRSIRLW